VRLALLGIRSNPSWEKEAGRNLSSGGELRERVRKRKDWRVGDVKKRWRGEKDRSKDENVSEGKVETQKRKKRRVTHSNFFIDKESFSPLEKAR